MRKSGPLCRTLGAGNIDNGTLCRSISFPPGTFSYLQDPVSYFSSFLPALTMTTSEKGIDFIYALEVGPLEKVASTFHFPGGQSGVTIGAGYDLRDKQAEEVVSDFATLGFHRLSAELVAKGVGLRGKDASMFANAHRGQVTLDRDKTLELIRIVLKKKESILRKHIHSYLTQYEFDALACFTYNPMSSIEPVTNLINLGAKQLAAHVISIRVPGSTPEIYNAIVRRRRHEARLFLTGSYKID